MRKTALLAGLAAITLVMGLALAGATLSMHFFGEKVKASRRSLVGLTLALFAASAFAEGVFTDTSPEGPAQTAYAPEKRPGPIVVVLSGASGPNAYQSYTGDISRLGYYAVLLAGKDILTRQQDGAANLKKAIDRAQRSPHALPGKVAVIGFSQGGGGALVHAASNPEEVSMVVAYYPSTSFVPNAGVLAKRFRVPVLVLAGERDKYNNCCLIESMRAMEAAAKESGTKFELAVYPKAEHGFNLYGSTYRRDDDRDAWRRTQEMLRTHHPLRETPSEPKADK
jgi:dienelactone hydrolase